MVKQHHSTPKNIVVLPFNAVGHVNGCRGATTILLSRGHRVYFILEKAFKGLLKPYGFEEIIYNINDGKEDMKNNPGEIMAYELLNNNILGKSTLQQKLEHTLKYFTQSNVCFRFYDQVDICLKRLMKEIKVDLFITDDAYPHPAIYYSDIPLIRCITGGPLVHVKDRTLPPPFTGLPSNCDPNETQRYWEIIKNIFETSNFSEYLKNLGYEKYPKDAEFDKRFNLTIYAYPKELNYRNLELSRPNWLNLEVFSKNLKNGTLNLKELVGSKLFDDDLDGHFSGKWIYVSLGSMGSIDLNLMRRLISVLQNTKHKYIVSKGHRHEEYDLPRNMWGSRFVPQIEILPLVDLVITHGGNNTITETFFQAKPMIVMPMFCDQLDNAQRLEETKYGRRIDPYDFDEQKLIDSIDQLLNDTQLKERLIRAADRIQKSDSHQVFCNKIEEIINTINL